MPAWAKSFPSHWIMQTMQYNHNRMIYVQSLQQSFQNCSQAQRPSHGVGHERRETQLGKDESPEAVLSLAKIRTLESQFPAIKLRMHNLPG